MLQKIDVLHADYGGTTDFMFTIDVFTAVYLKSHNSWGCGLGMVREILTIGDKEEDKRCENTKQETFHEDPIVEKGTLLPRLV